MPGAVIQGEREGIETKTVRLPTAAGGNTGGLLSDNPERANDVADELFDEKGDRRRVRVWADEGAYDAKTKDMRLIRGIDVPGGEDEDEEGRSWHWFELPADGDTDGSKSNKK